MHMGIPTSRQAIERVYREHGTQLWRGIYAFTGGRRDVADDAVAEAFARALSSGAQIRSPLPWLYRVAFRHAAARLREERRQDALPADAAASVEWAPEVPLEALGRLTPQQRAAVFLFYYEAWSAGSWLDRLSREPERQGITAFGRGRPSKP
jgi:DNA-directed RNA polymerase specialized sigma24 family protein